MASKDILNRWPAECVVQFEFRLRPAYNHLTSSLQTLALVTPYGDFSTRRPLNHQLQYHLPLSCFVECVCFSL